MEMDHWNSPVAVSDVGFVGNVAIRMESSIENWERTGVVDAVTSVSDNETVSDELVDAEMFGAEELLPLILSAYVEEELGVVTDIVEDAGLAMLESSAYVHSNSLVDFTFRRWLEEAAVDRNDRTIDAICIIMTTNMLDMISTGRTRNDTNNFCCGLLSDYYLGVIIYDFDQGRFFICSLAFVGGIAWRHFLSVKWCKR
jgi:hypothetical protein